MADVVLVAEIPDCDICRAMQLPPQPAGYDGKTIHGPWGYMCEGHFRDFGVGLGTGRGQRLKLRDM